MAAFDESRHLAWFMFFDRPKCVLKPTEWDNFYRHGLIGKVRDEKVKRSGEVRTKKGANDRRSSTPKRIGLLRRLEVKTCKGPALKGLVD